MKSHMKKAILEEQATKAWQKVVKDEKI